MKSFSLFLCFALSGCSSADFALSPDDSAVSKETGVDALEPDVVTDAPSMGDSSEIGPSDTGLVDTGGAPEVGGSPALCTVTLAPQAVTNCTVPSSGVPATSCLLASLTGCPEGVANMQASLKVTEPVGRTIIGTVILGGGGGGNGFYEQVFAGSGAAVIQPLVEAGYRVVQRNWRACDGWMTGPGGARRLAVRYASLADAIHKGVHTGGAFCGSGNSGGASEVSYALTHYGLGRIFDLVVPTSGPPMGRIDYGCLGFDDATWATECATHLPSSCASVAAGVCNYGGMAIAMDAMEDGTCVTAGAVSTVKYCQNKDKGHTDAWRADSVLSPTAIYAYPQTQVRFLLGNNDCGVPYAFGQMYYAAITSSKLMTVLPGVGHDLPATSSGAAQLVADLKGGCVARH